MRFKVYQVIIHIAGWLLFMAFPLLFINGGQSGEGYLLLKEPSYWLFVITYFFLYYFNGYVLIPNLFLKKRYVGYWAVVILLFAGIYFLKPYDRLLRCNEKQNPAVAYTIPPGQAVLTGHNIPPLQPDTQPHHQMDHPQPQAGNMPQHFGPPMRFPRRHWDMFSVFIFLIIMALSTAVRIIQQWQLIEQRATQAEADKASAELSFLKAQINPHFLFNTLNNIYTLALMKDENAPDSIMKLSNIMRYVTDDATKDFVSLQDEVDCINDYIELQRLRIGEKTAIDLDISKDIGSIPIAPLILMTFIENVFKYGISKHNKSVIVIKIKGNETGIHFFCQNKIFPEKEENKRSGIGLSNTRQRLEHLYPGKYMLDIDTKNELYTVELTLRTK